MFCAAILCLFAFCILHSACCNSGRLLLPSAYLGSSSLVSPNLILPALASQCAFPTAVHSTEYPALDPLPVWPGGQLFVVAWMMMRTAGNASVGYNIQAAADPFLIRSYKAHRAGPYGGYALQSTSVAHTMPLSQCYIPALTTQCVLCRGHSGICWQWDMPVVGCG
jgi:hypothetical protein